MKITRRQLKQIIRETVEVLREEAHDCIKDYMRMGYSRSEAARECRGASASQGHSHPLDVDGDGELTISEDMSADLKEAAEGDSCPAATQDKNLNSKNKTLAAKNVDIKYGHPSQVDALKPLANEKKLCGNCAAFDITPQMINCTGANKEGTVGYCKMHDFSCAAEKTCLTWAPGGPKKK